jgi:hypothetical protein
MIMFWFGLFLILPLDCLDPMEFEITITQSFFGITIPHQMTCTQEVKKYRENQSDRTKMLSTIL